MELESKITNIKIPGNIERNFILSGLGGSGKLTLTFAKGAPSVGENYFVHMRLMAGLPFIKNFHFEALAAWEETREGLSFVSYEEKDFSKKILKKWEFGTEGLSFIENKKGLVLEREIQYFKTPDLQNNIFDPISAGTLALLEKSERDLCIFGKQRIMHIKTTKEKESIRLEVISGINDLWKKILNDSLVRLNSENFVESIEITSPLKIGPVSIGKIKMQFKDQRKVDEAQVQKIVQTFRLENL